MNNTTYVINYGIYFNNGDYESHKIKVKNCMSEIHSKIKLEEYLKKKHPNFKQLVVYSCVQDFLGVYDLFGKMYEK